MQRFMLPEALPTPALVVHEPTVRRNIERMQSYCRDHQLGLRPHTKTHKSLRMAELQMSAGATGLTVAKVGEAEVMSRVSNDVLIAYPAVGDRRIAMLTELAKQVELTVGIDSLDAAVFLQAAAQRTGVKIRVLVDLEVGFFRTGIASLEEAVSLCQRIGSMPNLSFRGLMCFPGNVLPDSEASVWDQYINAIGSVLEKLHASGLNAEIVSGGSTPTARLSHRNPHLNEIRPGTYIYNDWNEVRLGVASLEDCAAWVVATVVSVPSRNKFVIDAGSKTLSSDRNCVDPDSGFGVLWGTPEAKISRLSEEHGEVTLPEGLPASLPKVGDSVWILPNHICVCVNLQNAFYLWDDRTLSHLPVDARGLLT